MKSFQTNLPQYRGGRDCCALDATCEEFSELMLTYPALWNKDFRVKLTLESRTESYLEEALGFLMSKIRIKTSFEWNEEGLRFYFPCFDFFEKKLMFQVCR